MHTTGQSYVCYFCRSHIIDALQYKVKYDPYYKDVIINLEYVAEIPEARIDVSNMLKIIETTEDMSLENNEMDNNGDENENNKTYTTSFIGKPPKIPLEI